MMLSKNQILILSHHISIIAGIYIYGFDVLIALCVFTLSVLWANLVGSKIMHFYFSHRTYKDSLKSYFYTLLVIFTGLGSPISFVASHRQHHKYADTENDPHSPTQIGPWRVYFLFWKRQKISPRMISDIVRSKFQKWVHKNWFVGHILLSFIFFMVNPILLFFVISPFVVYTFHNASSTNVFSHMSGKSKDLPLMKLLNWWGWDHNVHHNYDRKTATK
jgi:fatty-acid desaturase